jgi:RimJ/RimL family protein N-acetyltransferase
VKVKFLVRHDGHVIGTQTIAAERFTVLRQVGTGSWLGREHQGHGLGAEMRAAVLLCALDHLGGSSAVSTAFADNPTSRWLSAALGYRDVGTQLRAREGKPIALVRQELHARDLVRPAWELAVQGHPSVAEFLTPGPGVVTGAEAGQGAAVPDCA